jgi:hypothetical protein
LAARREPQLLRRSRKAARRIPLSLIIPETIMYITINHGKVKEKKPEKEQVCNFLSIFASEIAII